MSYSFHKYLSTLRTKACMGFQPAKVLYKCFFDIRNVAALLTFTTRVQLPVGEIARMKKEFFFKLKSSETNGNTICYIICSLCKFLASILAIKVSYNAMSPLGFIYSKIYTNFQICSFNFRNRKTLSSCLIKFLTFRSPST